MSLGKRFVATSIPQVKYLTKQLLPTEGEKKKTYFLLTCRGG